ncbi:hypothetical protein [Rhodanobacter sp. DHB23]|uniref:hypothetical protein n=1 Tax=Rhodanobacter sp. DHB23 TaxID=2775923 RepID=UPI00177DEB86|nr:hypothetical protein [Rhodanobacter sp. DHB23]MBD8872333.1 hypothetical protein [Rhodanobacter sp. DHB23]
MKPMRLLALPWMALSRPWRKGIGICFALLFAALVIGGAVGRHHPAWTTHLGSATAFIDGLFWAGVLSQSLLLAREAHHLRLPTLGREVGASLALYVLLTIALPALLLAGLGGNAAVALTEIAMGAALGLAYATLPPYFGICACFAPSLGNHAGPWLPMPSTSPDRFLMWAVPCTALLWLLVGVFWRSAVRRDSGLSGARRPIMLNLRTLAWYGRNRSNYLEVQQIRRRWQWAQPVADLRHCGPDHPVRSLRIAMGGWSMPQTSASRWRQLGILLASMLLPGFVMTTITHGDDVLRSIFGNADMLLFALCIVGAVIALGQVQTLQRRWSRHNAELPLLALLPQLGDAARIKRELLLANLLPAFAVQALLMLAMLGLAAGLHLDGDSVAMLLLGQLTGMGMLATLALVMLGGVPVRDGWLVVLSTCGYLLVNLSVVLALPMVDDTPFIRLPAVAWAAAIAWAGLSVPLLRLGVRGWQGLQGRPHPFLPMA